MNNIEQRIRRLSSNIPTNVTLIAVSKTFDADAVSSAYQAGQRDFGENKVQELIQKSNALKDLPDIRWHFIGHLQSNKAKPLLDVPNLHMIHSVDRIKIAKRLNRLLQEQERTIKVLVQVNASKEQSKFGCSPSDLESLATEISSFSQLSLQGLMTIGKLGGDKQETTRCFSKLSTLFKTFKTPFNLQHLSMGMTSDYKIAISEGSTMIRVGRAIFGDRALPDSHYWPE